MVFLFVPNEWAECEYKRNISDILIYVQVICHGNWYLTYDNNDNNRKRA